jgi:hypothetical protein
MIDRASSSAASDATVTLTATGTQAPGQSKLTYTSGYPVPLANDPYATLTKCPDDYDDVGTACCPRSYKPFTRALAGQTPCYSVLLNYDIAPRTMTAGVDFPLTIPAGQQTSAMSTSMPSTTSSEAMPSFPTSAVVNIVWAMQFPKSDEGGGLSAGAIAGAAVGSIAGVGALVLLAVFALFRRRGRRREANTAPVGGASQMQQQLALPGQTGQPMYYPDVRPGPLYQGYYPPAHAGWKPDGQRTSVAHSSSSPTAQRTISGQWTVSTASQGQGQAFGSDGHQPVPTGSASPLHSESPRVAEADPDAVPVHTHEVPSNAEVRPWHEMEATRPGSGLA